MLVMVTSLKLLGAPAALTWIIDRFDGKQTVSGCQHIQRFSNLEYPNIPSSIANYFKAAMDVVLLSDLAQMSKRSSQSLKELKTWIN